MKKYLPFFIFIAVASSFLALQIVDKKFELSAKSIPTAAKRLLLYTDLFNKRNITFANKRKLKLSSFSKRIVIVNFWASWCLPCLEEMPTLLKLEKNYEDVQVVYINIDDKKSLKKAKKIVRKFSIKADQLVYDSTMKIANQFMINSVPFTVVYDTKKAVISFEGETDFMAEHFLEEYKLKKRIKKLR